MWVDVLKVRNEPLRVYTPALETELDRWEIQNDLDVVTYDDIIDYIDIDKIIKESVEDFNKRKLAKKKVNYVNKTRFMKKLLHLIGRLMKKKGFEHESQKNTWSREGI